MEMGCAWKILVGGDGSGFKIDGIVWKCLCEDRVLHGLCALK